MPINAIFTSTCMTVEMLNVSPFFYLVIHNMYTHSLNCSTLCKLCIPIWRKQTIIAVLTT